jgi:spore coat protein H
LTANAHGSGRFAKSHDVICRKAATVVSEQLHAGYFEQAWNTSGLASGVYVYRLSALALTGEKKLLFEQTRKLTLTKQYSQIRATALQHERHPMKLTLPISVACLLLVAIATAEAQNPGDVVFAGIKVHTINIKFSQPAYWDSLVAYYNAGLEQYMAATVFLDSVKYDSVGVRFKGQSSFTHPNNKKPFRLAFDQYRSQKWDGLKGVHLNNCWGDPSFMREKIHLDFCRDAGVHAPRGNFAQVFLNDTLWGLYSMEEHVNKTFLGTHFGNSGGDQFKAVDEFSGESIVSDFRWYGNDTSRYTNRYEMKTDGSTTAWPALVVLLDSLNNSKTPATTMPARFDMPAYYKAMATDILFGNLDSYLGSGRNFYFYFNTSTGKVEWIVWDVSLSFGAYNAGISSQEAVSITYVVSDTSRPLMGQVLSTAALKQEYLSSLSSLFNTYFTSARLFPHIDSIANVIRPYVYADSRKMFTNQQFETNISSDVSVAGGSVTRKPGLKSFITSRISNIKTQLTTDVETSPAAPGAFALAQNFPNPFNPTTVVSYQLAVASSVRVAVFDLLGREIATLVNELQSPGTHEVRFDATGLPSGMYVYRLTSGTRSESRKMMLMK